MEQPREFDPFMCMWGGGWARLGAWGGAQARGQGWSTAWPGQFVEAGISLELSPGFSITTPSSEGQGYPSGAEPLGALLLEGYV